MSRQNDFSCSDDNDSDQILLRLYRGPLPSERFSFQTEIHLCNQGLLSVPDYFLRFHFVGLRVLNLSGNSLRALPEQFSNDRTVRVLNVACNELQRFPSWIANMIRLKQFDFSHNPISEESWASLRFLGNNCRRLRWIKGQNCNFSATIPIEACRNKDLLVLTLGNENGVQTKHKSIIYKIPTHIAEIKGLVELSIANASVKVLPESLSKLQNLEVLDLQNNEIRTLPHTFCNLKSLKSVNLAKNFITELPFEFEKLSNLVEVFLSHNELSWIPQLSFTLTKLRILDLYSNRLSNGGLTKFNLLFQGLEGLDLGMNLVSKNFIEQKLGIENYGDLEKNYRDKYFLTREPTSSSNYLDSEDKPILECDVGASPDCQDWTNCSSVVPPVTTSNFLATERFCPSDYHQTPIYRRLQQSHTCEGQFSDAEE